MIHLSKDTIDHIFEPRRAIRTATELEAAVGRLLTDGDGRFFCLTRGRSIDRQKIFYWQRPSRPQPEMEMRYSQRTGWKRGTYPAWECGGHVETNVPWQVRPSDDKPLYEVLPQPIHQGQIILAFYRIAFSNWDDIVKIDGYPRVNEKTWKYIMGKFMAFDNRNHPDVIAGGSWALGAGFSAARPSEGIEVPEWKIDVSQRKLVYKDTPFYFTIQESTYGEQDQYHNYRPALIYDGGLRGDVDPEDSYKHYEHLEDAQAACAKRAGESLSWERLIGPRNPWGEGVWQSSIVGPRVEAKVA